MRLYRLLMLALVVVAPGGDAPDAGPRTDTWALFSVPKDPRAVPFLDSLGVGWVRLQAQLGEPGATDAVPFFTEVLDNGYGLWLTVHHRDRTNVADTLAFDASTRGSFPPVDSARYAALVEATVGPLVTFLRDRGRAPERWLVVQFGNEVLPSNVAPDQPIRFWHGSSGAYLRALAQTAAVVRRLDPAVPVAAGSLSSATLAELVAFEAAPVDSLRPLVDFADSLLTAGTFDWADVHLYHDVAAIPDKVGWVKARWGGPLAASEDGGPDERTGVVYSDSLQAAELAPRLQTTLAAGVDRVFWSFLVDRDLPDDRLAQTLGLLDRDWVPKPAYAVYRDLIAGMPTGTATPPVPSGFTLAPPYPNPFSGHATIGFSLPAPGPVSVAVFDGAGRRVRVLWRGVRDAGPGTVTWDGRDAAGTSVAAGLYFVRLRAGAFEAVRPLTRLH